MSVHMLSWTARLNHAAKFQCQKKNPEKKTCCISKVFAMEPMQMYNNFIAAICLDS